MKTVPVIPRKLLFGNPDKSLVQISPDGRHLAYLAPRDGVLNLWVAPRDDLAAAEPVTHDTGRGIHFYLWAHTNRHLLYIQDKNGDENGRIYSVEITTGIVKDLTPFEGVQARLLEVSRHHPCEIVVALNNRRPEWHDLYRLNLGSGRLTLLEQTDQFFSFVIDEHYRLVLAVSSTAGGGQEIFKHTREGSWEAWSQVSAEDNLTTYPVGMDDAAGVLFMKDSRGRDTSAMLAVNLATGNSTLLAADPHVDVFDVVLHPTLNTVQAVSFVTERKIWQVLDPAIRPDLAYLTHLADGEMQIVSRSLDDQFWVVLFLVDNGPIRFYLYDRSEREARFLFSDRAELEGQPLVKMHSAPSRRAMGRAWWCTTRCHRAATLTVTAGPPRAAGIHAPRGSVGTRSLGLQRLASVAGQSRLCRAGSELSFLDRFWQDLHQCGRPAVGGRDYGRPDRRRAVGHRPRDYRPAQGSCDGRQFWGLFHPGRADTLPGGVRLRR